MTPDALPGDLLADDDLDRLAAGASHSGYLDFLKYVVVDSQPTPALFPQVAEDWQWEREERSAPAIDRLAGLSDGHCRGPLRFWHGYHKGCDKTHAIARKLCFLLGWSQRPLKLYACAGDKKQAALITLAMETTLRDNPWVAERIGVSTYSAAGVGGSSLEVMPMEAATGQGIFPDYVVAEEVSHWQYDAGRAFWNFIVSSVNKRPNCVLEVCTNAGHVGSWQWGVRDTARSSRFWDFYEAPEGVAPASWMSQERIAEDSKLMDPGEFDRLHRNRWIDPGEERGYLTLADAEACVDPSLAEAARGVPPRPGVPAVRYVAVVDYGSGILSRGRDRTALAVLHAVPGTSRVVVDRLDCWENPNRPVPIDIDPAHPDARSVEGWIELVRRNFLVHRLVLDPHQMESLAQKYERKNLVVERYEYHAGKKNMRMAQLLRTMVQNRLLSWSPDAGRLPGAEDDTLAKELARLVLKPTIYGYRFDHESGRHDDRAAVVGMGLTYLVPAMPPSGQRGPTALTREQIEQQVREQENDQTRHANSPRQPPRRDWVGRWSLNGVR